jgi:hypothetical protein
MRVRVLLGILLIFTFRATAFGQGVVQVTNGDRITGNVSKLERGELAFSTTAAGTIDITWSEVVRLTSMQMLDVELRSGMRYTGPIDSPADGQLVVQTASGPTMPIALSEILRITEVGATFLERTTGEIDFGLSVRPSTTTYNFDGSATNRTRRYQTDLLINSYFTRQDEAADNARNKIRLEVRRYFTDRWFTVGIGEWHQDDELDLDWRLMIGGGVGRTLIESVDTLLRLEGGVDYDAENFTELDETDHSAEVFGAVHWDWWLTGPTKALVDARTEISLDRPRFRLEFDAKLRRDLFWDLYWSVNVFDDYDSDPPGDRSHSAFGMAIGLGWSF